MTLAAPAARSLALALACAIAATPARAASPDAALLVGSVAGAPPADAPVQARLGERVTLHAVVRLGRGAAARYHTTAPSLVIGGRQVPARQLRPWAELGAARVAWHLVEPRQHHVDRAPPNVGNPAYSNAVLFGPRHGQWLGYDRLEYHETELAGARGPTLTLTRVKPTHPKVDVHGGRGTMRYKIIVRLGDRELASPGGEATRVGGIAPQVLRVSFRDSDDLVGWLASYFNVPNVFGSGGHGRTHQSELYQGADCADVIIGAVRQAGAILPYTSVLGLRAYARPVTEKLLLDEQGVRHAAGERRGTPVVLRFGEEVRVGDIMLIDYVNFASSPRGWDHVAIVAGDRGVKGRFDPADPILHMGYLYGLTEAPAGSEGPAIVQFLRWNPSVLKAIARQARQRRQPRDLAAR